MTAWIPYREPLGTTILRTGAIAAVIGGIIAYSRGDLSRWPLATLLALWPTFGGHWIEIWFLNFLRPKLPHSRSIQMLARLIVWFFGGILLGLGMALTATLVGLQLSTWNTWWIAGLGFIGIELVVHRAMQMGGRPNFYNGLG